MRRPARPAAGPTRVPRAEVYRRWAAAQVAALRRRSWAFVAHAAYPLLRVHAPSSDQGTPGAGPPDPAAREIVGDGLSLRLAMQGVHVFEADREPGGAGSAVRVIETTTFPRRLAVELRYSLTLHAAAGARSIGAPPGPRTVRGVCVLGTGGAPMAAVRACTDTELDRSRLRLALVAVVLRSAYGGYEAVAALAVALDRGGEQIVHALEPLLYLHGAAAHQLPRLVSFAHELP